MSTQTNLYSFLDKPKQTQNQTQNQTANQPNKKLSSSLNTQVEKELLYPTGIQVN